MKLRALLIVPLSGLAFIGFSASYVIRRDVIGSGGQRASSSDYVAGATLGQAVIGHALSEDYGLCHGFWCNLATPTPMPTSTPGGGVPVGAATLMYTWTFDEVSAAAGTSLLVVLFATRWLYDGTLSLWGA